MRAFIEMQIDLDGYVAPEPDPASPVVVRQAVVPDDGAVDLRTMYQIISESFRDHYDFQLRSFEDWVEAKHSDQLADPTHWYLAEIDGEAVGGLMGHNSYLEADNAGYVANLGVLRQGRGRGVAKALLRTTLWAEFALLGVVSGVVAAIGAEVALALLQSKIFDFPWSPDWRLWVMLPLCGAILLSLCGGWLGLRLLKGKALFRQFSQG